MPWYQNASSAGVHYFLLSGHCNFRVATAAARVSKRHCLFAQQQDTSERRARSLSNPAACRMPLAPLLNRTAANTVWELHEQRYCPSLKTRLVLPDHFKDCPPEAIADACVRICEGRRCNETAVLRSEAACYVRGGDDGDAGSACPPQDLCHSQHCAAYDTYRQVQRDSPPFGNDASSSRAALRVDLSGATIALCVIGVANHAMVRKTEDGQPSALPIYNNRTFTAMVQWRRRLLELGHRSEVFLVLDLAEGWRPNDGHAFTANQAQAGFGSKAWRRKHNRTSGAALEPMLRALRPEAFSEYVAEPYCSKQPCACTAGTSIWWEQQAKLPQCLGMVEAAEARRGGLRFDFIAKLRSDHALDEIGPTPDAVAAAVRRGIRARGHGRAGPRAAKAAPFSSPGASATGGKGLAAHDAQGGSSASVAPWSWKSCSLPSRRRAPGRQLSSIYCCYRESDWAAVVARDDAPWYFNLTERVTCAWLRCFAERYSAAASLRCHYNEPLLIDWLVWHGLNISVLGDASIGPSLWSRTTQAESLQRLEAPSIVASERIKAALSHDIVLSDAHIWFARAFNGSRLSAPLSRECRQMLDARATRYHTATRSDRVQRQMGAAAA